MDDAVEFEDPPVVEVVLGAQFSPLTKLTTGHLGWYWRDVLGSDWATPSDGPAIDDQFELFDLPHWHRPGRLEFRLTPASGPGRLIIDHRDADRRLQAQSTRFHLNWRRRGNPYPTYDRLVDEFQGHFDRFQSFIRGQNLGELLINQWELTYIDAFPSESGWQSPGDWAAVLPGLFGNPACADGLNLENRAANWTYEIEPRRGRLHVSANTGRVADEDRPSLLLQMTARGPVGREGVGSLREGLDLGHGAALRTFLQVISPILRDRWEPQP